MDIFNSQSSDEEQEPENVREEIDEGTVERTITEVTKRFVFVRGGEEHITYHTSDKRDLHKEETTRNGIDVEQFPLVEDVTVGWYSMSDGGAREHMRVTDTRITGEVTTANVAFRETVAERELVIRKPARWRVKIDAETGEEIHRGPPGGAGEMTIEEASTDD